MQEITDLNELKKIELDIMKKIHIFCTNNNIKYTLSFGSLIGAVRHKGFIPWDDDIDICMLRKDYEKFCSLFPKYGNDHNLRIANAYTNPRYLRAMSKIYDVRTVLIEPEYKYSDPIGVFVDVFPIDGTPRNSVICKIHMIRIRILILLFFAGLKKDEFFTDNRLSKRMLRRISNMIGLEKLEEKIEKVSQKYTPHEEGYVVASAAKLVKYNFSDLLPVHLAEFEDTEFFISDNYDSMLRKAYGDYMILPPESMQKPHHVINTFWK